MPSDIIGTEILEEDHGTGQRYFKFQPGPVFTNLLLADEINRTPPKTQAALLEAMQERTVSYAGTTHRAARAVLRAGDAEPDRAGRHLSAAGSAARPLPAAHPRRLSGRGRGARRSSRRPPARTAARSAAGDGRRRDVLALQALRARGAHRRRPAGLDHAAGARDAARRTSAPAEVQRVGALGRRSARRPGAGARARRRARCCTGASR